MDPRDPTRDPPNADIDMSWEDSDMRRQRTCLACRRAIPVPARKGGGRRRKKGVEPERKLRGKPEQGMKGKE